MSTPVFPLGDPNGEVVWTPALLKKVFPRRELSPKPPKVEKPAAIWRLLHETLEAFWPCYETGASLGVGDDTVYASVKALRDWLSDPVPTALDPEGERAEQAALLLHVADPCDGMRAQPLTAQVADLFVALAGHAGALKLIARALSITMVNTLHSHQNTVQVPCAKPRRGYGDGPTVAVIFPAILFVRRESARPMGSLDELEYTKTTPYHLTFGTNFLWPRLRHHMASAPEAARREAEAVAEAMVHGPGHEAAIVPQFLVGFCFPERPEWAEAVAARKHPNQSLFVALSASVRDPSVLPYVKADYFWDYDDEIRSSILAAAGPKALKPLLEQSLATWRIPLARISANLLACIGTKEALTAMAKNQSNKLVEAALIEAKERFPDVWSKVRV